MSILIKGMKMPTERAWVDVRIFRDGTAIVTEERAHRTNRQAIELPPHGRLIDEHTFLLTENNSNAWTLEEFSHLVVAVKSSPTIIEAE